jgi:hypothetical protein
MQLFHVALFPLPCRLGLLPAAQVPRITVCSSVRERTPLQGATYRKGFLPDRPALFRLRDVVLPEQE